MLARLSVLSLTLILLLLNPSTYASPIAINPAAIERRGGSSSSLSTADPLGSVLRDKWGTVKNNYPIILVHGFGGFGKPLLDGLNYFAQKHLESLGYTVYVADLGPVSSNWERACELYAQIKGTRVDYGKARSSTYGFSRYGRNFTGKVNLLTHSMGGPTSAMMLQLLATGFQAEVDSTKDGFFSLNSFIPTDGGASKFLEHWGSDGMSETNPLTPSSTVSSPPAGVPPLHRHLRLSVTAPFFPINSWSKPTRRVLLLLHQLCHHWQPITLQHVPTLTANPVFQRLLYSWEALSQPLHRLLQVPPGTVEVPRGGRPVKGVYLGTGKQLRGDHLDVVGMFKVGTPKAAYAIARNAAAIMASTP
ncbi:hypothetical protein BC829DRAFT_447486 [Chytridium lagenaria]|nr:hypothetical protein BC829DRAFT_447486 [Chytridium lagenaria]